MIHFIIFGIALILIILAIINAYIIIKSKENQYPKCLTLNWTAIFIFYMAFVIIGYTGYIIYPYIINFFEILKGLLL